jgi:hypothetical protein
MHRRSLEVTGILDNMVRKRFPGQVQHMDLRDLIIESADEPVEAAPCTLERT